MLGGATVFHQPYSKKTLDLQNKDKISCLFLLKQCTAKYLDIIQFSDGYYKRSILKYKGFEFKKKKSCGFNFSPPVQRALLHKTSHSKMAKKKLLSSKPTFRARADLFIYFGVHFHKNQLIQKILICLLCVSSKILKLMGWLTHLCEHSAVEEACERFYSQHVHFEQLNSQSLFGPAKVLLRSLFPECISLCVTSPLSDERRQCAFQVKAQNRKYLAAGNVSDSVQVCERTRCCVGYFLMVQGQLEVDTLGKKTLGI